jgi:L-iditol 2-dehydrogenase
MQAANVKTNPQYPIPETMKAWVLGNPGELTLVDKPVPTPKKAEVLVRIDAVAICATDLEIIKHGPPSMIQGGLPFNKNFTPGHEYMGTVVALGPGVDEYAIGDRVTVEIHAGCGQCVRCRQGMYTSCHNYGKNYGDVDKGHRANGFTTDGGFCEYQVNSINTLVPVADSMSDEEATLVVTAGVWLDRTRRSCGRRKRRRHRAGADRTARRGRCQGPGCAACYFDGHSRQSPGDR